MKIRETNAATLPGIASVETRLWFMKGVPLKPEKTQVSGELRWMMVRDCQESFSVHRQAKSSRPDKRCQDFR